MSREEEHQRLSRRDEFLLKLYDHLWDSIDRKESAMWEFVALYGVVTGLMLASGRAVISQSLAAVVGSIVSFWGMNVAINSGKWFNRNRLFVVNIEKQFLLDGDVGRILPASYHERRVETLSSLSRINLAVFLILGLASLLFGVLVQSNCKWRCAIVAISLLGTIVTVCHFFSARRQVREFIRDTRPD